MSVVSLNRYRNKDVLLTLAELLSEADAGKIFGLMYVKKLGPANHRGGMSGDYRDNPDEAVQVAAQAMQQLYLYSARKRIDPMTASNIGDF